MAKMKWYDWIFYWLIVIGALNWGVIGFYGLFGNLGISYFVPPQPINFGFDLLASWLPVTVANIIFLLVGVAGLFGIATGIKLAVKK